MLIFRQGFSFLEIIISLFILGLVTSIAVPRYLSSKTVIDLKTTSHELSEFFFLSHRTASSRGTTINVTLVYSEDDPESIDSLIFTLPHPTTSALEEKQVTISDHLSTSLSQPITMIEFYPDKTWSLFFDSSPSLDPSLTFSLSYNTIQYNLLLYPHSSSIQLLSPD